MVNHTVCSLKSFVSIVSIILMSLSLIMQLATNFKDDSFSDFIIRIVIIIQIILIAVTVFTVLLVALMMAF